MNPPRAVRCAEPPAPPVYCAAVPLCHEFAGAIVWYFFPSLRGDLRRSPGYAGEGLTSWTGGEG